MGYESNNTTDARTLVATNSGAPNGNARHP